MDDVSRETLADAKAAILAHLYDTIDRHDIAIVYLDVESRRAEAEFYFPATSEYRVYSVESRAAPLDWYTAGKALGKMAIGHLEDHQIVAHPLDAMLEAVDAAS